MRIGWKCKHELKLGPLLRGYQAEIKMLAGL